MIAEIVTFPLPEGTDRAGAVDLYLTTAGKWAKNTDLIRKSYFFDEARGLGGGVYLWPSREVASRWHGDDYRAMVRQTYGAEPQIEIFDVLIDVDPETEAVSVLTV